MYSCSPKQIDKTSTYPRFNSVAHWNDGWDACDQLVSSFSRTKDNMADFLHQTYNVFSSFATYPFQLLSHCFPPTFKHFAVQIIPYGFLGSICYILDVIFLAIQHRILRALVDNMAHGVIAFVSWCVVSEVLTRKDLADGVLSAFIACALDVDHFIAARSFNLQVSV